MKIFVDIDETIAVTPKDRDYSKSIPYVDRINRINTLYEEGNYIVYWTARGTGTGIDWKEITESQLRQWGAKYHELRLGKPVYDLFIDDKNINSEQFFGNLKSVLCNTRIDDKNKKMEKF